MSPFLTVSQINNYISYKIKNDPKLKGIAVKGEISGYVRNFKSGHAYFSLKDENSLIKCVMFSSSADKLKFQPENGMSVIAICNVDVYERDGVYQLMVFQLLPAGAGEDALRLEMLKSELASMGVFDKPKQDICKYPKEIAVVTSTDAAALGDIITTISRRYPIVKLSVYPTSVQGSNAPDEIANAIMTADKSGADTLIVARGGGSKEDLAAYNSRQVAFAVYNCVTPVISAVGHEIDVSLCDVIADLRAPTPTAAAELATPDMTVIISDIKSIELQMRLNLESKLNYKDLILDSLDAQLAINTPATKIDKLYDVVGQIGESISSAFDSKIKMLEYKLDNCQDVLESLNPENLLKKGYAIVYKDSCVISDAEKLSEGDKLTVRMRGGIVTTEVEVIERNI